MIRYVIKRDGQLQCVHYDSPEEADVFVGWGNAQVGPRSQSEIVKVCIEELEVVPPLPIGGMSRRWRA